MKYWDLTAKERYARNQKAINSKLYIVTMKLSIRAYSLLMQGHDFHLWANYCYLITTL